MKVFIEPKKCVSSGQCVLSAPGVFDQHEEDGIVYLLTENPSDDLAEHVREAVMLCPAQAIRLEQ